MVDQIVGNHSVGGAGNPKYLFKAINSLSDRIFQEAMSIPFVSTTPENTILYRFGGQQEEYSISFYIYDDGVDAAGGTAPTNSDFSNGTVITVQEQIVWLKKYLFNDDFDTVFTFTQDKYVSGGINCLITDLSFNNEGGQVQAIPASMTIKVGKAGTF